ncbi:MAG: hypothetical protein RQ756_01810 [Flavobacteriaceae bacterium]|nr:hypothetical protein [Flavobacteriaceae bacterium]
MKPLKKLNQWVNTHIRPLLNINDTQAHILAGGVLASLTTIIAFIFGATITSAFLAGIICAFIAGLLRELGDSFFDFRDLLATYLGAFFGSFIVALILDFFF